MQNRNNKYKFLIILVIILSSIFFISACEQFQVQEGGKQKDNDKVNIIDISKIKTESTNTTNQTVKENKELENILDKVSDKLKEKIESEKLQSKLLEEIASKKVQNEQEKIRSDETVESKKEKSTKEIVQTEKLIEKKGPVLKKVEKMPYHYRIDAKESDLISLNVDAFDPDSDKLTITFSEPFNKEGKWQTKVGDAGQYTCTVTVSDGNLTDTKKIMIVVDELNHAPKIGIASVINTEEGKTLTLEPVVTDADGDKVTVTYSGWLTSPIKRIGYDEAGTYNVTITASDGNKSTQKTIVINVKNVNRPPVFELFIDNVKIVEGDKFVADIKVSDPDKDEITVSYEAPLYEKGEWQTKIGDAGTYKPKITATDGQQETTKTITIVVEKLNRAPVFIPASVNDITVKEGDTIKVEPKAEDPDKDNVTFRIVGWMSSFEKKTTYNDAGQYEITVIASDGKAETRQKIKITVLNVNRAPIIKDITLA